MTWVPVFVMCLYTCTRPRESETEEEEEREGQFNKIYLHIMFAFLHLKKTMKNIVQSLTAKTGY